VNDRIRSRYPGYDVLAKRDTPSWDEVTRKVIDTRLAQRNAPRFCNDAQWRTLSALSAVIVPQSLDRSVDPTHRRFAPPRVPVAGLVDTKLADDARDGYRDARLPPLRDAWRIALAAIDAESRALHRAAFADLGEDAQRDILERMQRGELKAPAWEGMPCDVFFSLRLLHDICSAYYSHPLSWSEIGFGGPANPRGYVRMQANRRDPWEPVEARPGQEAQALKENVRVR
jgi:Gluconate 2-dehydrogenase subunit 3